MSRTLGWVGILLCGALAPACTPDQPHSGIPLAPSVTADVDPLITGAVLGPDGANICNSLSEPFGAVVVVRPIIVDGPVQPNQFVFCPDNTFSFGLPPGNHFVRAALPNDPAIGNLPTRTLEPLVVSDFDITRNIVIQPGKRLLGRATLDGAPLPDVGMVMVYDVDPRFGAAFGASGSDAAWTEFFRVPMILQTNVTYQPSICGALGVVELELPPPTLTFPQDSVVNCTLETAPSTKFSHHHNRVVVTPMPGDIGGQTAELPAGYGRGWGVQFPIAPGDSPFHVPETTTHLFGGGLMIGIAPDRILSGANVLGQLACGTCQDLGQDGVVRFTPETPRGRVVTWQYSDADSPEGVGLRVVQRSFDGQPPNDYVLFRYSIQKTSPGTLTFYAGAFADWDVDEAAFEDIGFTEMNGRLMAVTSTSESGIHVGTLLLGAPIAGTSFWDFGNAPAPFSTEQQFQALSGGIQVPEIGEGDTHYIHGAGPITLRRGQRATIWIGIIAGEDRDQFLANAQAAAADVARRQGAPDEGDGTLTVARSASGVMVRPSKHLP
jgi:hypothetical protein